MIEQIGTVTISLQEYEQLKRNKQKIDDGVENGDYTILEDLGSGLFGSGRRSYLINLTRDEFIEDLVTRLTDSHTRFKKSLSEIKAMTAREFKKKYC